MKRFIAFCLVICFWQMAFAQAKSSFLGVEVAYSADIWKHEDPGGYIVKSPLNSAIWGLNFRHMFSKYFFVEIGLYARQRKIGIAFSNNTSFIGHNSGAVILPVRAGFTVPVIKQIISITPMAGLGLSMTSRDPAGRIDGAFDNENVNIEYSITPSYKGESHALVLAGLGIDFRVAKRAVITLNSHFYSGLTKVVVQRAIYNVDGGPDQYATSTNKGSFLATGIGFRYKL